MQRAISVLPGLWNAGRGPKKERAFWRRQQRWPIATTGPSIPETGKQWLRPYFFQLVEMYRERLWAQGELVNRCHGAQPPEPFPVFQRLGSEREQRHARHFFEQILPCPE